MSLRTPSCVTPSSVTASSIEVPKNACHWFSNV